MVPLLLAFLSADLYDLTARIEPPARASVSVHSVASPFTAATLTEEDGRFTFKKLEAGAYTVAVFIPSRGEARQTIEVGPGTSDDHHRVALTLELKDSDFVFGDPNRRRHAVSAKQLAIPEKAIHEYQEAQTDLARRDFESATRRL